MLVGAFVLLPIWVLVLMATDGSIIGYPSGFHPIPVEPTLDRFRDAFFRPGAVLDYWGLLRNSLLVSVSSAARRARARRDDGVRVRADALPRPRRRAGGGPARACSCRRSRSPCRCSSCSTRSSSRCRRSKEWGFRDSLLALSILYASFAMPVCLWLMRAAFRAVPADLEEAAFVDGATRFYAFRRITLPLATPSILVAALVAFLLAYTEFALAWLFISTNENVTLAMILAQATTGFYTSNWSRDRGLRAADGDPGRARVHRPPAGLLKGSLAASETD